MSHALDRQSESLGPIIRIYDNLIMLFLLMALGTFPGHSNSVRASFAVAGFALWAPARAWDFAAFPVFQLVAWIACSAILVVRTRDSAKNTIDTFIPDHCSP